jgi:hypothetical protein
VSFSHAQTVETIEDYKAVFDSIVPLLRHAEKDANNFVNKPFSEFLKHLNTCGVKIIRISENYDSSRLYPKDVFGIGLRFTNFETFDFAASYRLKIPGIAIYFKENKPYEEALSISKKHKGYFTKEVETFYSDVVIKSIVFYSLDDDMYYHPPVKKQQIDN